MILLMIIYGVLGIIPTFAELSKGTQLVEAARAQVGVTLSYDPAYRKSSSGVPLVIHNIGGGAQEENVLFTYPHTGHFRVLPP